MKGCKTQGADNQPKQPRLRKIPEKRVTELCTHRWEGEERCSPYDSRKYDGSRVQPVFCRAIFFC